MPTVLLRFIFDHLIFHANKRHCVNQVKYIYIYTDKSVVTKLMSPPLSFEDMVKGFPKDISTGYN